MTHFLVMPVCNDSTAEALFTAVSSELESRDMLWKNVIGYTWSVYTILTWAKSSRNNWMCWSLGCMCHIAVLCAVAALKKLPVSVVSLAFHIILSIQQSIGVSIQKSGKNSVWWNHQRLLSLVKLGALYEENYWSVACLFWLWSWYRARQWTCAAHCPTTTEVYGETYLSHCFIHIEAL